MALLPGGPLEICFSFDTTISMTSYVDQVKARLKDMVQRLKSDIPGIKIALFAHGDYFQASFDNKSPYVTRHIDFTDDVPKLCKFITESVPTAGGDWDECYEMVMKEAREKLTWSPRTNRVLVMLGDAHPHPPKDYDTEDDFKGLEKLDWKEEIKKLLDSKIRSYGVYCKTPHSGKRDRNFFQTLSKMGEGSFLELQNFDSIFDFMMAICYREHGEDAFFAYEAEIRGRSEGAAKDVHHMLTTLKKSVSNASSVGGNKPATKHVTKPKPAARRETKAKPKTMSREAKAKKAAKRVVKPKPNVSSVKRSFVGKRRSATKTSSAKESQSVSRPSSRKTGSKRLTQHKSKQSVLRFKKLRREKVPETNFALRDFPWSPWKILMSSEPRKGLIPVIQRVGSKDKAINYTTGLEIFKGKTKQQALYELAVKPLGCRQKKIVYAKVCPGFSSYSVHWSKALINSKSLNKQIQNVIVKQGGDIFMRRLILKKYPRYENIPSIVKNYDYVWVPNDGAKKYRELKKDSYVISEEMDVE